MQEAEDIQGRKVLTAYAPVTAPGWLVFVELPREEAYAPLLESIQRSACCCSLGLALAVLAGMFLARRMVVPIQALRAGAARIGSGDLGQRISIKTGDELESARRPVQRHGRQAARSPMPDLEKKVEDRTRELSESLEQQTATAEVLRVISSSPGELEPVFEAMLENATRICEAKFGNLFLCEGDGVSARSRCTARRRHSPSSVEARADASGRRASRSLGSLRPKQVVHIADLRQRRGLSRARSAVSCAGRRRRRPHLADRADAQGG